MPTSECGCDRSGTRTFCMHHLQAAFDVLEAMKGRYPNPLGACGFADESVIAAVWDTIPPEDFAGVCERLEIPPGEAAATLFIDGLMMGVLLAAIAPTNHAARIIEESSP